VLKNFLGGIRILAGLVFFLTPNILNPFYCLEAIHYWHIDVENYDIEVVHRVGSHNLNCLQPVFCDLYIEVIFKLILVHVNHQGLIIDKKHLGLKDCDLV